jgi:hypothetical protein
MKLVLQLDMLPTASRPVHLGVGPPFGVHDHIFTLSLM